MRESGQSGGEEMSAQFAVRSAFAAVIAVAIPICLMLPGTRTRLPSPHTSQTSLTPFGTLPGQPIPTRLAPPDQAAPLRRADVRTDAMVIEIEYREPVTGGDQNGARNRIYAQVQKDCDAAARKFHKTCSVGRVAFDENPRGGSADRPTLLAHAQLRLAPS
jgi:hypothetical protein